MAKEKADAMDIFGLTVNQSRLLFSIEKYLVSKDIDKSKKDSDKKKEWLVKREKAILEYMNLEDEKIDSLYGIYDIHKQIAEEKSKTDNLTWYYLIIFEAALFHAYTDYYRDIEKFLAMFKELTPAEYSKSEADEKFRDINSIKIIPDDVYEDNREVISECIDIMHSSNADRREKNDARTKLDSYVISIQLYAYKKYPDGIDRDVIYGSDIHRSCIMYDFNVVDLTGAGLVLGEYERDIYV